MVKKNTNDLYFFIYNELGKKHIVDLFLDNIHWFFDVTEGAGVWRLIPIGDISNTNEIFVFVDKKLVKTIKLNDMNRNDFKINNSLIYLNYEN